MDSLLVDRRSALALVGGGLLTVAFPALPAAALLPTPTAIDLVIAGKTIFGEARGEAPHGRLAVAYVIRRRAELARDYMRRTGSKAHALYGNGTLSGVCLAPWQFSCWNRSDRNRAKLDAAPKHPLWGDCLLAVQLAIKGIEANPAPGADHYTALHARPAWARKLTPITVIGRHKFYKLLGD